MKKPILFRFIPNIPKINIAHSQIEPAITGYG
jgi:hypothetical protein